MSEDGVANDVGWTANNYTELLYSLQLKAANLAANDTLRFRVLRNGVTTGMTYSVTPTINIKVPVALAGSSNGLSGATAALTVPPPVTRRDLENDVDRVDEAGVPRTLEGPYKFSPLYVNWRNAYWVEGAMSQGLSDGAEIPAMTDDAGTMTFTQADPAKRAVYRTSIARLNNKPGIDPDGVDDYYQAMGVYRQHPLTIVTILAPWNFWGPGTILYQDWPGLTLGVPNNSNNNWGAAQGATPLNWGSYAPNFNAHLFVAYFNLINSELEMDNDLATSVAGSLQSTGAHHGLEAAPLGFLNSLTGTQYFYPDPIAFVGIFSGDARTDPNWPDFVKWAQEYYGVPTPPAPVAPFPTAGLHGWYDATDDASFTYSNGNDPGNPPLTYVSQWNDLSGKANHQVGSANSGYHPKRNVTINGLKALDYLPGYINVEKGLVIPTLDSLKSKPSTYSVVLRMPATLVHGGVIAGGNAAYTIRTFSDGSLDLVLPGISQVNGGRTAAGIVKPLMTYVISTSYSLSGDYWVRVNGVEVLRGTNNHTPVTGYPLCVNAGSETGGGSQGYCGEAVIYDRVLSLAEIEEVEDYLIEKWIWTPRELPGIDQWFDADQPSMLTTSGGRVTAWRSASPSLVPDLATPGTGPLLTTVNGRPAMAFSGDGSDQLNATGGVPLDLELPFYVFAAIVPDNAGGINGKAWLGIAQPYRELYMQSPFTPGTYSGYISSASGNWAESGLAVINNVPQTICAYFGTGTGWQRVGDVTSPNIPPMATLTNFSRHWLLARGRDGDYGKVTFCEFFTVQGEYLNQAEIDRAVEYLRVKWLPPVVPPGPVALVGSSGGISTAGATSLGLVVSMVASATGLSSTTGTTLVKTIPLVGTAGGLSTAGATTTAVARALVAVAPAGTSTTTGTLTKAIPIVATATGTSTATATTLVNVVNMVATAGGTSTAAATTVAMTRGLAGTTGGSSTTTAATAVARALVGTSTGLSTDTGISSITRGLAASAGGTSTTVGTLDAVRAAVALVGSSSGTSTCSEVSGVAPALPVLIGLAVHLDASQLVAGELNVWPNLGSDVDPAMIGSPLPAVMADTLNGMPVVRFVYQGGRLRGTAPTVTTNLTVVYVVRRWGPNVGRALTATYPGTASFNFLVGFHTSSADWMYDNGDLVGAVGWVGEMQATPTPWRLYSADATSTPSYLSRFFIDGVQTGVNWPSGQGMGGTYNLSGYDATGTLETMDCEVAELVIYDRKLADVERISIEDYLRAKWFQPIVLGGFVVARALVGTSSGLSTTTGAPQVIDRRLVAAASGTSTASATTLSKTVTLAAATGDGLSSATGTLAVGKAFIGTTTATSSTTGALSAARALTAPATTGTSSTTGALAVARPMAAASAIGGSTTTGALVATKPIAATATGTSTATGSMTVARALVGSTTGTSTAAASIVTGGFTALVTGTSTATGSLGVNRALTGSSSGIAAMTGALSKTVQLTATAGGSSTTTAAVGVVRQLAGSTVGASTTTGAFIRSVAFVATSGGLATTTAALARAIPLAAATADGGSTTTGNARIARGLVGSTAGLSTAVAATRVARTLAASSSGQSTADALSLDLVLGLVGSTEGLSSSDGDLMVIIIVPTYGMWNGRGLRRDAVRRQAGGRLGADPP